MHLSLTDEQLFLQEAATGALSRHDTLEGARAALDGAPAPDLWPLAAEAGWPGLLVAEDADGAGLGAYEALLVLECCGRRLADARLLGHLPATALLQAAGGQADLLGALARGERRAALVDGTQGVRAADGTLDGAVSHVLDADGAGVLVVLATDGDGAPAAALLPADAPGVVVAAQRGYDATRALAEVSLAGARATPLDAGPDAIADALALQRALLAGESVGSADAAMTMTRDYAIDRVAFDRPIGSYQAIKHKLVEMLRRIEGARSLLVAAGRAWDGEDRHAFRVAAQAARVAAADALDLTAPETIFIHGGVGATWEHDAQLFYRRAELSRRLAGGAEAAAQELGELLLAAA